MPDYISILKEKLDIQRPNSANPAIFEVELSPTSNKEQRKSHFPSPHDKKRLDRAIPKIPTEWEFKPPKRNPPPVPGLRKQSNIVDGNASTKFEKPFKEKRPLLPVPRGVSDPPYVEANMKGLRQRSSLDPEITKSGIIHLVYVHKTFWKMYISKPLMRTRTMACTSNYMSKVNNRNTRTMCEMFKVNNKGTRTTSLTLFWCLYC